MAYSKQTFTFEQVLTAAQCNQLETNIADHVHGRNSVGKTGLAWPLTTKTASFAVGATDVGGIFSCANSIGVSLPAAATAGAGFAVTLVNIGSGAVTVFPNGSERIDGLTSVLLAGNRSVVLHTDGNQFFRLGSTSGLTTIVASTAFAAANNVDITDIPQGHSALLLEINSASGDTSTRAFIVQVSVDNGVTFDTTMGNYVGGRAEDNAGTAVVAAVNAPAVGTAGIVQTGPMGTSGTVTLAAIISGYPNGSVTHCSFSGRYEGSSNHILGQITYVGTTAGVNGLRLTWNGSGNFDAGSYRLIGID